MRVLLLLMPSLAYANSDSEQLSLGDIFDLSIVTASRVEESASKAPGTVEVITKKQIEQRGYRFLEDALKDLPAFYVMSASDAVTYNRITVRGIKGNNKFVILQNGIRISSPTGEDVPVAGNFPLYNVKQIEIVYGPASALYGADAFTGVINLITGDSASNETNSFVTTGYGENEDIFSNILLNTKLSDSAQFSLGLLFHGSDNFDLSEGYSDEYPLNDLETFGGDVIITAAEREKAAFPTTARNLYVNLKVSDEFTLGYNRSDFSHPSVTGTLPNTANYNRSPQWRSIIDTLYIKYGLELTKDVHTEVQLSYSRYQISPESKFANIFTDYEDGYEFAESSKFEYSQQFFLNLNETNHIVLGLLAEQMTSTPKSADLLRKYDPKKPRDLQDLVYHGAEELDVKIFHVEWANLGAFAQLKTDWSNELFTTVGVRFDESTTYGATTNPRAGVVWLPNNDLSFKLLYGEAFLAPSPRFTYEHYGSFAYQDDNGIYQSFFMHIPNADLKPEEMVTLELNGSYNITETMKLDATIYQASVDEMIAATVTDQPVSDFIEGGNIATTQINDNVGKLKILGSSIVFRSFHSWENLTMESWLSYSQVDGDFTLKGLDTVELPFSAREQMKAGVTLNLSSFVITPSVRTISKATATEIGALIGHKTSEYTMGNLFMAYRGINNLELALRATNLADRKYYNPNVGSTAFSSVPQDRRELQAEVKYRF